MSLLCRDLAMTFPSGFRVGPVSWSLGPGVHHLVAPNGAGKTTLLRCLCGAWRGSAGVLEVCGRDPRKDVAARAQIAFVPAEPELPAFLTVDEAWQELAALRGQPRWAGERVRDALEVPGALLLGHCSSGQRRRAELVAGLAGDPRVLLLDEPFANLDPGSAALVARVVEGLRRERVIVVTSHSPLPVVADTTLDLRPVAAIRG